MDPATPHRQRHRTASFFVLRSPLLPFDDLEALSAAPSDQALAARLAEAWRRPEVREAVHLASPALAAALDARSASRDDGGLDAPLRKLAAYLVRTSSRATPFGTMAGLSVGRFGARTRLRLPPRSEYRRHSLVDVAYLVRLAGSVVSHPAARDRVRYVPNSSIWRLGDRLRYVERRAEAGAVAYYLVSAEATEEVTTALAAAEGGATEPGLIGALTALGIPPRRAEALVRELVGARLLVADLEPTLTGPEACTAMAAKLRESGAAPAVADALATVGAELARLDAEPLGIAPLRYAAATAGLDGLPGGAPAGLPVQVDLTKPADLELGPGVRSELLRGLRLLLRIAPPSALEDPLEDFRELFVERYGDDEVSLAEALDPDVGIAIDTREIDARETDMEPLVAGLDLPAPAARDEAGWLARDEALLHLLVDAERSGRREVELRPEHLRALEPPAPPRPAPALDVTAQLSAASVEDVDRGRFRLWIRRVGRGPGAGLLTRFCHGDAALRREVEAYVREEEALAPGAVHAELVHLPVGRLGNILRRPLLRDYEIVYLGGSGAPADRRLGIDDLTLSVVGGRIVLRSRRLGREVLPRLTSAQDFNLTGLPLYRFLCLLQGQGRLGRVTWTWGALDRAPFLPRVVSGRVVLSRARWNLARNVIEAVTTARPQAATQAMDTLRKECGIPRHVALVDGGTELALDLESGLGLELLAHFARDLDRVTLVELFPPPDELCVTGPEGRFTHELVVPFLSEAAEPVPRPPASPPPAPVRRRFPPGSEWLYAKVYAGPDAVDRLLCDAIAPLVAQARSGGVTGWFFVRYADPEGAVPERGIARVHAERSEEGFRRGRAAGGEDVEDGVRERRALTARAILHDQREQVAERIRVPVAGLAHELEDHAPPHAEVVRHVHVRTEHRPLAVQPDGIEVLDGELAGMPVLRVHHLLEPVHGRAAEHVLHGVVEAGSHHPQPPSGIRLPLQEMGEDQRDAQR